MSTEEKIKDLEKDFNIILESDHSINEIDNIKKSLRNEWETVKKDEDLLALAISIVNRDKKNLATEIYSPTIASLILLDYKDIDPLIYEVLINIIYSSPDVSKVINTFTFPFNYSFLTTTFFNPELSLNKEQLEFLVNSVTVYYKNIHKVLTDLKDSDKNLYLYNDQYYISDINKNINSLNNILSEKDNDPHFINTPADIRYFILNHPIISGSNGLSINDIFISFRDSDIVYFNSDLEQYYTKFVEQEEKVYKNYELLLHDAPQRVKIRKSTRMPF